MSEAVRILSVRLKELSDRRKSLNKQLQAVAAQECDVRYALEKITETVAADTGERE